MQQLIQSLSPAARIAVDGIEHRVLGLVHYVAAGNPGAPYAKAFLDDHRVLVIAPADDLIYYGEDQGDLGLSFDQDVITYQGQTYHKAGQDDQIVVQIAFGDPLAVEGEVCYCDFVTPEGDRLISLGTVRRTGMRADVVARIIHLDSIRVLPLSA